MEWLNYHHLYYFWTVMNEGSIARASSRLRLAQSTVSSQLSRLENHLGGKLFNRVGRRLEPTDMGRIVYRYADDIFSLGRELVDTVRDRPVAGAVTLRVGIVDAVPKLVARKLLKPAGKLSEDLHLKCHEGKIEQLFGELALHHLDVVLTDAQVRSNLSVKVYNHLLGESGISFFAVENMAVPLQEHFPQSLDGQPLLMPMTMTTLRGRADQFFDSIGIRPRIVGEFDDNALLKVYGQAGEGVFMAPTVIENEVVSHYQVTVIGRTSQLKEEFYAVSAERIIRHPAVVAISKAAQWKIK